MLHLATGAVPRRPDLPGIDLPHVHGVQTLDDAAGLLADAGSAPPGAGGRGRQRLRRPGAGRGVRSSGAPRSPSSKRAHEVMGTLDPDMGALVARAMRDMGITVRTGEPAEAITEAAVHTADGRDPGRPGRPRHRGGARTRRLAADAGLETGVRDAIVVDRQQRTLGRRGCGPPATAASRSTWSPAGRSHEALGTVANKQGRVAGINISGGYATFPGVARHRRHPDLPSGDRPHRADRSRRPRDAGFAVVVGDRVESTTTAGYMPDAAPVTVKLLAERGSGRLLGAQIVGGDGAAKRVDVVAAALAGRLHRRGPDRPGPRLRPAVLLGVGPAPGRGPAGWPA